jgi:hypothetical protein
MQQETHQISGMMDQLDLGSSSAHVEEAQIDTIETFINRQENEPTKPFHCRCSINVEYKRVVLIFLLNGRVFNEPITPSKLMYYSIFPVVKIP